MPALVSKAFALLSVAPALNGFREKRSDDAFTPYDGMYLMTMKACNAKAFAKAAELVDTEGCRPMDLDLTPPAKGQCSITQIVCDKVSAKKYKKKKWVTVDSKDAGEYFRVSSGSTKMFKQGRTLLDSSFYSEWRDLDARNARVKEAVGASGGMAKLEVAGKTLQGRDIYAVRFTGTGYIKGGPKLLLTSNIHAREWISGMSGIYAVETLSKMVASDPSFLDGTEVVIMYMANPDGFVYSTTNDRMHRKNMRENKGLFCRFKQGVDLNRNFDVSFGKSSSGRCSRDDFHGEAANSEPETRVIAKMMEEAPMTVYIDIHAFSKLILSSWGYKKDDHPRRTEFDALGQSMKVAIEGRHGATFTEGPIAQTLYEASGSTTDYATNLGALGFCYELRPGKWAGGGFAPPPNQIVPAAEESWAGLLVALEWVKSSGGAAGAAIARAGGRMGNGRKGKGRKGR